MSIRHKFYHIFVITLINKNIYSKIYIWLIIRKKKFFEKFSIVRQKWKRIYIIFFYQKSWGVFISFLTDWFKNKNVIKFIKIFSIFGNDGIILLLSYQKPSHVRPMTCQLRVRLHRSFDPNPNCHLSNDDQNIISVFKDKNLRKVIIY